jgi:predicted nucleic acid-binding protein
LLPRWQSRSEQAVFTGGIVTKNVTAFWTTLTVCMGFFTVLSEDFYMATELTQQHPLKAYDAVQLAVALHYRQVLARYKLALTFVSGDTQLLAAAAAEELAVDNPFDHAVPADTPGA